MPVLFVLLMLAAVCCSALVAHPSWHASLSTTRSKRMMPLPIMDENQKLSDDAIAAKLTAMRQKGKRRKPAVTPPSATSSIDSPADNSPTPVDPEQRKPVLSTVVPDDGVDPMERLRERVAARAKPALPLDANAAAEIVTYLNEELGDEMIAWVMKATEIGKTAAAKNAWSGGSWVPISAQLEELSSTRLCFRVGVRERGKSDPIFVDAQLSLPREATTCDDLRRELLLLSAEVNTGISKGGSATAGKGLTMAAGSSGVLLRLPGTTDDWSLPRDLWLNTTPYPRSVRNMFYTDVAQAMQAAVADPTCSRKMRLVVAPPELNMEMDSYRVGTLLELVRECALGFAELGLRTRVCVQGSMGEGAFTGVPRVLSGVRKVLTMMDWQAQAGEDYEGLLGAAQDMAAAANAADGDEEMAEGFVRFGAVGEAEVKDDDDVLLVLAPQSMVGASIYEPLKSMTDRAVAQGAAIILLNPLLQDRQSSSGLMGVRGRAERLAFADSFEEIYTFRLLYSGTTFMFPILGSLRMTRESGGQRVLYQRRESGGNEQYEPVGCWLGRDPTPEEVSAVVPKQVEGARPADGEPRVTVVPPVEPAAGAEERMPWD